MKSTLSLKAIMSHDGSGWNSGEKTEVFQKDGYTVIVITNSSLKATNKKVTVSFRNCVDNEDSSIQFEIEAVSQKDRTTHVGFSVPKPMAEFFMQSLSIPYKAPVS